MSGPTERGLSGGSYWPHPQAGWGDARGGQMTNCDCDAPTQLHMERSLCEAKEKVHCLS